jgi:hypothetical protein
MEDRKPMHCTACGSTDLEKGFIQTEARQSTGLGRWISGVYKSSLLSNAPKGMKERLQGAVVSYRCRRCSHLEQFVELGWTGS